MKQCPKCRKAITESEVRARICPHCKQSLPGWRGDDSDADSALDIGTLAPDFSAESPHHTPSLQIQSPSEDANRMRAVSVSDQQKDIAGDIAETVHKIWSASVTPNATPLTTLRRSDAIRAQRLGLVINTRNLKPLFDPVKSPNVDYVRDERLGMGGMGIVDHAKQTSVDRPVAVKTLRPEYRANTDLRNRFLAEASLTGKLAHPNIVPIHDLGVSQDDELFYSMKLVTGTRWDKRMGELSLPANLQILSKVCDAVAFAHSKNVIHRDLKPENVMLGEFNEVLVMDWGLAFQMNQGEEPDLGGGTPAYMPPEMAIGPSDLVGSRSDIYLLAAILYEIIAGRPPHAGATPSDALIAAARNVIIPFQADDTNEELLAIANRSMDSDPANRHGSVLDFQQAIRDFEEHEKSIALTNSAENDLAEAHRLGDYDKFARSLFAFQDAIELWPGNERAVKGLRETRLSYAQCALEKSNFELGMSVLDTSDADQVRLHEKLNSGARARDLKNQTLRRAKLLAIALCLGLLLSVTGAFLYTRDLRFKAEENAIRARAGEAAAERERQTAQRERDAAEVERKKADKMAKLAENKRQEAEHQTGVARDAQQQAETQRQEANKARTQAEQNAEDAKFGRFISDVALAASWIDGREPSRALGLLERMSKDDPQRIDWEWHRLYQRCHADVARFQATGNCESICANESSIVTVSNDRLGSDGSTAVIESWDRRNFQLINRRQFDNTLIRSIDASPVSNVVAIAGHRRDRGVIALLDISAGEILKSVAEHGDDVFAVRFSADGRQLVSAGNDGKAILWRVGDRSLDDPRPFQSPDRFLRSAVLSRDGRWLVTCEGGSGGARAIMVWPTSGDQSQSRYLSQAGITLGETSAVAISPNSELIATATDEGEIRLWDWRQAPTLAEANRSNSARLKPRSLAGHQTAVRALSFSPDGTKLLSASDDRSLVVWSLTTDRLESVLAGHSSVVVGCVWDDTDRVTSVSSDGEVRVWRLSRLVDQLEISTRPDLISANFDAQSNIVTTHQDGVARVWSSDGRLATQLSVGHVSKRGSIIRSALISAGGVERLFTSANDRSIWCWDAKTGRPEFKIDGVRRDGLFAVSDNGKWLATAYDSETPARVWSLTEDGARPLDRELGAVVDLAFLPNSDRLLMRMINGRVVLRDVERGRDIWSTEIQADLWQIARDGGYFITARSARNDQTAELTKWSLPLDGTEPKKIASAAISGRAAQLAIGTTSLLVITTVGAELWDVESWKRRYATPPGQKYRSGTIAPETDRVLLLDDQFKLQEWESGSARLVEHTLSSKLLAGGVRSIRFVAKDRLLACGESTVELWEISRGVRLSRFPSHRPILNATMVDNGSQIVSFGSDGFVRQWRSTAIEGSVEQQFEGPDVGRVTALLAGGSDRFLSIGTDSAQIWDATPRPPTRLVGYDGDGQCADWSVDGSAVVIGGSRGVKLWESSSGALLAELPWQGAAVNDVKFSKDGNVLAAVGEREATGWAQVFVRDQASREWKPTAFPHSRTELTRVAFSARGHRLVTGDANGSIVVWYFDPTTRFAPRELMTLSGHRSRIRTIEFSADGRNLLTASLNGKVFIWLSSGWPAAQ